MVDKKIYIIQGEIATVVGAIKRNSRWNTHTPLVSVFMPAALDWLFDGLLCWLRSRRENACKCTHV